MCIRDSIYIINYYIVFTSQLHHIFRVRICYLGCNKTGRIYQPVSTFQHKKTHSYRLQNRYQSPRLASRCHPSAPSWEPWIIHGSAIMASIMCPNDHYQTFPVLRCLGQLHPPYACHLRTRTLLTLCCCT